MLKISRLALRVALLFLAAAAASLAISSPAPPAPPDPALAAAGRLREFAEAFNSGEAERLLAFYRENMTGGFRAKRSEEEDRALYRRLRDFVGTLEKVRVLKTGPLELTLSATTARGDRAELVFEVAPAPPHLLAGYDVDIRKGERPGTLPSLELPPGLPEAGRAPRLQDWLESLAGRDLFSGAVAVARGGELVYQGAFGAAHRERGIPNTIHTLFDLGSITKAFTKVAAGQLLQEGKLSLDDTVMDHLPGYPDPEAGRKIRIRHLLEHTSGLGDIFTAEYRSRRDRLLEPRDFFPLFAGKPLQFPPGSGKMYSNAGYVLLGAIVEAASGTDYEIYVKERIFQPAGMDRSGFVRRDGSRDGVALGYTRWSEGGDHHGSPQGPLRPATGRLPVKGCPAGSSSSSAGDLLRFYHALAGGKLLSPAWTRWFFTGDPPGGDGAGPESPPPGGWSLGITGGGPGVSTALEADGGWAVVVLANLDPPVAGEIARKILEAAGSPGG